MILGIDPQKYETISIYLTKNSEKPNVFEQNGKKVFYISEKPKLPFFKPLAIFKLAKILKREKVDILHCHMHKATVYGVIAGRLAGVPVILAHVHGMGRTRNLRRKLLNRFILHRISRILAVGQAVKEDILLNNPSLPAEKVVNIGNSIDYNYYSAGGFDRNAVLAKYNIPADSFVFATAGRLAATKGQTFLIEAFAKIKNKIPNAKLLFAGSGQLKEELEKKAADLGCRDSVYLLGRIDNMPQFYCGIDCFILSSVAEGLPRVILEAMAAGVLCIASNIGGIPEILDSGRLGFLVPPENPDALANMMLKIANMTQYEKSIIISGAKNNIKENYNHTVLIKRIENIYGDLIAKSCSNMPVGLL